MCINIQESVCATVSVFSPCSVVDSKPPFHMGKNIREKGPNSLTNTQDTT